MQIEFGSRQDRNCQSLTRRSLLKIGSLALGGMTLSDLLRIEAAAEDGSPGPSRQTIGGSKAKAKSVILIWQGGGPSHLDMWDLKPNAPAEIRGDFRPIGTNVPGYEVGEHMPHIAKICDKLSIIRSVTHANAGHEAASHFLLTGYLPSNDIPAQEVPSYGSIVGKELGPRNDGFPAYVAVPTATRSSHAAYLGVEHNPFEVHGDPNRDNFSVRNLKLPGGMKLDRLAFRQKVLKRFDSLRRDVDASGELTGMDQFYRQAFEMVTSTRVQQAFNMAAEKDQTREAYGRHTWGQSCLLARRLVEAGVRFVNVNMGGWDTHGNNFATLKDRHLPQFEVAFQALIEDLHKRGLLDETLVLVWGEFGRTPRINAGAGRDHWPNVFTAVMAGGGLKPGIIGQSDSRAEEPRESPHSPQDVLSTMYHQLGISQETTYSNTADRPVAILNEGKPIKSIL